MKLTLCPIEPATFLPPYYATSGAAAFDILAQEPITLTNEPIVVSLGFRSVIPEGHVGILLPRSGFGFKYGVRLRNTAGVIDHDFRGEWKACVFVDEECSPLRISRGERFLQCIIEPIQQVTFEEIDSEAFDTFHATKRGNGGFGSTGI